VIPVPSGAVDLPDGRRLAYDGTGDPAGRPVVYLHGCPDCRLTRHPDDSVAAAAGVQLLAVDRAGYGGSGADPAGTCLSAAGDVVALADALGIARFGVLGWSSGGLVALALAAAYPDRVAVAGIAAGLPPIEADDDPEVAAALDEILRTRREVAATTTPVEFAEAAAPFVAPLGLTLELAEASIGDGAGPAYLADLNAVPGLRAQLALGAVAAVAGGLAGVEQDCRALIEPLGVDLIDIAVPVLLWYGSEDARLGPACGRWLAERIPGARLSVVEGASHLLPLVHWGLLLDELVPYVPTTEVVHAAEP
jgi:pimeloyl-ACP methyl ester carboxylesterase